MSWEPTAWAIGGGAEHSPEVARLLAHAATGGAEGIVTPGDLKVLATATPGTAIRVAPGAALIANAYAGGQQQTYAARNTAQHEVEVQATSSGGKRSDLVVARIHDPQYGGDIPPDPLTHQYVTTEIIPGVPVNTETAAGLNLGYPAIELARIDLPASTATVQSSHVEDLRKMAQPRKERHLFVHPLVAADGTQELTSSSQTGIAWPGVTAWRVDVPPWANRVRMLATWGAVLIRGNSAGARGRLWVRIGAMSDESGVVSQDTSWDTDRASNSAREAWIGGDDRFVPAALRGRNVPVYTRGRVIQQGGTNARPVIDYLSVVSLDIEFYETRV